jgi:hypothetical protein
MTNVPLLWRRARLPHPRSPGRLEDIAGVVHGFCSGLADTESSSHVDVAAKATDMEALSDAGLAADGSKRRQSAATAYRKHCGAKVRTCTVVTSGLLSSRSMIGWRSASSMTTVLCS